MQAKFAKLLANNIATIAGNVAHVALIDAKIINDEIVPPLRADACAKVEACKASIAEILMQPGARWDAKES